MRAQDNISKSQFAKEQRVSRARVAQWVKDGLPCQSDGKLDRRVAVRWLDEHVKRRQPSRGGSPDLLRARVRKESALASLAEIELQREQQAAISIGLAGQVASELRLAELDIFQGAVTQIARAMAYRFNLDDLETRELHHFVEGIAKEQLSRIVRVRESLEKLAGTAPVEEKPNG